jgi:hypothetical protein
MMLDYLSQVGRYIENTKDQYAELYRIGLHVHPIPFFGDVMAARVLTVGVNPSAGEFDGRAWPESLSIQELEKRLRGYFICAQKPHKWFETWSDALNLIGSSYLDGAAHLDLSSRATISMGNVRNQVLFENMVESDSRYFFELLPRCTSVRLLLLAGCVSQRRYMNDFIARVAPQYGFELLGHGQTAGEGRVGFHRLIGQGIDLPVFFCSVSPSGRNPQLLIERVKEYRVELTTRLGTTPVLPV